MSEELLEKKCPRCGAKSANPSNPSGRCRHHLNKLASDKQKPGSWQRAQTLADGSLRRQDGKNGTAHHKSKGRGNRKEIVSKMKSAEKKVGQRLSPDRLDNSRGYGKGKSGKSNVRAVPVALNRGRHHVDSKKLRAWQKRLHKCDVDYDGLYTMLLAKAEQDSNLDLLTLLRDMDANDLANWINNNDIPEPETTLEKANPFFEYMKNNVRGWIAPDGKHHLLGENEDHHPFIMKQHFFPNKETNIWATHGDNIDHTSSLNEIKKTDVKS